MPLETLSKYTPTELEKIVESPCPFYIPRKRVFSGVYKSRERGGKDRGFKEMRAKIKIRRTSSLLLLEL